MLAYIFERFPKLSQTFCYREIMELFRQGASPRIFSLRTPETGAGSPEILWATHVLPDGDAFAARADEARKQLSPAARRIVREWRGQPDSLRLHQAAYLGVRLQELGITRVHAHFAGGGAG